MRPADNPSVNNDKLEDARVALLDAQSLSPSLVEPSESSINDSTYARIPVSSSTSTSDVVYTSSSSGEYTTGGEEEEEGEDDSLSEGSVHVASQVGSPTASQFGGKTAPPRETRWQRAKRFLIKNFLVIGLIVFVIGGALIPEPGEFFDELPTFYVCVSLIFFISGLRLSTNEVKAGFRAWKSCLFGTISILFITPMLALGVLRLKFISSDFLLGLAVFCNAPTTLTSGPILTQQANGNLPVALLLTVVTNLLCVVTIPFILPFTLFGGDIGHLEEFELDSVELLTQLLLIILLPLCVGKAIRESSLRVRKFVMAYRVTLKLLSAFALILIPWMKVSVSSDELANRVKSDPGDFCLMVLVAVLIHIVYMVFNRVAVVPLRVPLAEVKAVVIMTSEKTLPVTIAVVSLEAFEVVPLRVPLTEVKAVVIMTSEKTLPVTIAVVSLEAFEVADQGLMSIAVVCAHISQIVIDGIVASWWQHSLDEHDRKRLEEEYEPAVRVGTKSLNNPSTAYDGLTFSVEHVYVPEEEGPLKGARGDKRGIGMSAPYSGTYGSYDAYEEVEHSQRPVGGPRELSNVVS